MNNVIHRIFFCALTVFSLTHCQHIELTIFNDTTQHWSGAHSFIHDYLDYQEDFSITIEDSLDTIIVDIENKKIKAPRDVDNELDQIGMTPQLKFELAKAFGRAYYKDAPYSFFTSRPRLTTASHKLAGWLLFVPCLVTAGVGTAYIIDGMHEDDYESFQQKSTKGMSICSLGLMGAFLFGSHLLDAYGVSCHFTKASKHEEDATFFAVENLSTPDLTTIYEDLKDKPCAALRDSALKNFIALHLEKRKSESQQSEAQRV